MTDQGLVETLKALSSVPKSSLRNLPKFKSSGIIIRGAGKTAHPMRILRKFSITPVHTLLSKELAYKELIEGSSKHLVFYDHGMQVFCKIPVKGFFKKPMFILKEIPRVLSDGYLVVGTTDATKRVFRVTRKDLVRKRVGSAREVQRDALFNDPFLIRHFTERTRNDSNGTGSDSGVGGSQEGGQDLRPTEGAPAMGGPDVDMGIQEQILALSRV